MRHILLLAGTREAREIARGLHARGACVDAVLSEPARGAAAMPVPTRLLDEVSSGALAARLGPDWAMIDASHGFDGAMTEACCAAARVAGVPAVSVTRPAWALNESASWHRAEDMVAAVAMVPPGARVFAATGWASLAALGGFAGARLFLRQSTRHDRPPPEDFVEPVFGDGPFSAEGERALFERLGIDLLICRNLGGQGGRPKLDAAKAMGLPVLLIDRPPKPAGLMQVPDAAAALDWAAAL